MKGYLAIMKMRMKVMFRYRAAAFAGICTQVFWGLVQTMVLTTFYASTESPEPISLSQAISFIWIGQAILGLLPWTVDKELEAQIKNGHIAYELIRPLRLHGVLFARSFANRFTPMAMRALPVFLIGYLCFDLPFPKDLNASIAFIFSVAGAIFLSTAMTTLLMISFFWTIAGEGIQRFIQPLFLFLSGTTIPLPLFPDWIQPFLNVQPFRGLVDIPCRLYTGVIPSDQAYYYVGFQLFWAVLLLVVGQFLLNKATKRFAFAIHMLKLLIAGPSRFCWSAVKYKLDQFSHIYKSLLPYSVAFCLLWYKSFSHHRLYHFINTRKTLSVRTCAHLTIGLKRS